MNHETALWAIFILLCVLFVIVVVTAHQREKPEITALGRIVVGVDPAGPDGSGCVVVGREAPDGVHITDLTWLDDVPPPPLAATRERWEHMGIPRSHIRIVGKDDKP